MKTLRPNPRRFAIVVLVAGFMMTAWPLMTTAMADEATTQIFVQRRGWRAHQT
jgi:hypothetical protein